MYLLTTFLFKPVMVDGISMEPTLKDKAVGFSSVVSLKTEGIQRFDIVIIQVNDQMLVKRVIALPGETVRFENNRLYINDVYTEEPFLSEDRLGDMYPALTKDFGPVRVGENEYFCMGDNRAGSVDSRRSEVGVIPEESIKGKVVIRLFPFSKIKRF